MPKLIDLSKVRWTEGFYDMQTGEQYAPMLFNTEEWLEWATAEAKVEVIPIEWLENFMNKLPRDNSTDGMSWTSLERWGIKMAISEWEKENE